MQRYQHEKTTVLMMLLVGVMLFHLPYEHDTNWPMFMHDLQNTGYSPSAAPNTPYILWEFDTEQRLFGSPVVQNGTVYQVGRGALFAIDSETGNLLWMSTLSVIGSTPAVKDEVLYVGTCNGIAALNSETGRLVWQLQLADFECNPDDHDHPQDFIASSPMVTETGIIMCTHRNIYFSFAQPDKPDPEGINRVVCLDPETGTLVWEYSLRLRAGYSPALAGKIIYINSSQLRALSVETGEQLWSYPAELLSDTSPVISDVNIITVSKDGTIYSIDSETHELLWKKRLNKRVFSTPAVWNNIIVVTALEGMIFALDENTGDIVWETEVEQESAFSSFDMLMNAQAPFDSSPAIADDKIYVGLRSGVFLCLELETGDVLWQYQTEGAILASPAVADEKVFIASTDGKLYCFGIDPETYFEKGEKYEVQGDEERAQEFYIKAKEYYESQGNLEMVKKCEEKLKGKIYFWVAVPVIICIIGALLLYRKMHKPSS